MFNWHTDHPSLNETLIAGSAAYQAFDRYLVGTDLYLLPRSRTELEAVLYVISGLLFLAPVPMLTCGSCRRRYAHDAIHNTIAQSRAEISAGSYSRVSVHASSSTCQTATPRPWPCDHGSTALTG